VVKGPMSVLYGQIQPGGFVNIIAKKPKSEFQGSFDLKGTTFASKTSRFGDANGYDFDVDVTGLIDTDRRFLYRMVAEHGDRDTARDFVYERSTYLAPSATWNVSDATSITLLSEYRKVRGSYDDGIAVPSRDLAKLPPLDR